MMSNRTKIKTCCNKGKQKVQSSTKNSEQLEVISLNTIKMYHGSEHVWRDKMARGCRRHWKKLIQHYVIWKSQRENDTYQF
jgi:hypothetical protein